MYIAMYWYTDIFTVSIDDATVAANVLTIDFSAATAAVNPSSFTASDISPTVYVALYGYDTKDFVARISATEVTGANGVWEYTADLAADEANAAMIADGTVRRVEIGVLPDRLIAVGAVDSHSNGESDDTAFAVNAPSRTFELAANAFDDTFYSDIVDVEGCNSCHDALATTFHAPNRGGNIKVCRMCHVPTSGASHLEMQSRKMQRVNWSHLTSILKLVAI